MYGIIGKLIATAGDRDELITILLEGTRNMPGCHSYIIARDTEEPDSLWVTEIWENQEMHAKSLSLPSVQAAITAGKPLIAAFGERFETLPVGGHGLQT